MKEKNKLRTTLIYWLGAVAAIITIFTFTTGKFSLQDLFGQSGTTSVVEPVPDSSDGSPGNSPDNDNRFEDTIKVTSPPPAPSNPSLLHSHRKNSPEKVDIAVLIVDSMQSSPGLSQKVRKVLQSEENTLTTSLFLPSFVSDGSFSRIFNGDVSIVPSLNLQNFVDFALFGIKEVTFSPSSNYLDSEEAKSKTTAHVLFSVTVIDAASGEIINSFSVKGNGMSSNKGIAEDEAVEKAMDSLAELKIFQ